MLMKPFRFFSQKVLPVVYDDSLSYYEVLGKLTQKINEIIENDNLLREYIGTYMPMYAGDWDITQTYDPLSVVSYQDALYIARTAVPAGISIEAADYWAAINLPYYEAIYNLAELNVLHPDQFEGTDSEKINQAFDAIVNGGTLCLNRQYVLDDDIIIKHLTSTEPNYVHVIGIGKNAEIVCNGYGFRGDPEPGERIGSNSVGGIFFQDVNFTGTENDICFFTDRLIRMFFTGCHFYGMGKAFYGSDTFTFNDTSRSAYAQSYYFSQCYFGHCKEHAFDVYKPFDCHFNNCIFEYDASNINVRNALQGLFITNCLLESMPYETAIKIHTGVDANGSFNLSIADCYFENNSCSIDLCEVGYTQCNAIERCQCVLNNRNQIFIHMPRNLHDKYGGDTLDTSLIIMGNSVVPANGYDVSNVLLFDLFHQDGTPWQYQLTNLLFQNNNFGLTHSNASLEQIYTLNYRPFNKTFTKRDVIRVYLKFAEDGGQTNSGDANKPLDTTGDMYYIVSLKDTHSGLDICRDSEGVSEDPNTWFYVDTLGPSIFIRVIVEDGAPVVDRDLLRERAGDKLVHAVVAWKYNMQTAPGPT